MLNLLITLFIGFEIQKLFQFDLFFRLKMIALDYKKFIIKKTNSIIYTEIVKLGFAESACLMIIFFGLFSINAYFFCAIYLLSVIENLIFKIIKNKLFRKIIYYFNTLLNIILLSLSIINSIFYHLSEIQLLKILYERI